MKRTKYWKSAGVIFLLAVLVSSGISRGQDVFPDGSGKETMLLVCVQCHSLNRITEAELQEDDWSFTLYDMIARGAPVPIKDVENLRTYLIDNYSIADN